MKKRNSSIELLKIIAIILIIIQHSCPVYGNVSGGGYINIKYATTNIQQLIISILSCLGEIGNIIFIMCSSWFLLEKKFLNISKNGGFISFLSLLLYTIEGENSVEISF